ncbi:maltose acetyltransferase domain-containing protein [Microbacterium dauci]|uniref:Acetyltransferase n=1 Tax=Microbacterium dauci TaxID=3048008 RepID=A0ABT6ZFI1_9MICO|nr:maltose acetyltransferase domain-containing protein [Microbacterium sp. LX3-4]MDJ1114914.1 maltose acetyltransferase domain-containing protein [Microbacterium sp. LX3-4]
MHDERVRIELSHGEENARRMRHGELYNSTDPALVAEQLEALERLHDYNHSRPSEDARRKELLTEMFESGGETAYIEPPFHANWAGKFVTLGAGFYANFNMTLVDDAPIHIGADVMFGPNVTITTAGHPVLRSCAQRRSTASLCRSATTCGLAPM